MIIIQKTTRYLFIVYSIITLFKVLKFVYEVNNYVHKHLSELFIYLKLYLRLILKYILCKFNNQNHITNKVFFMFSLTIYLFFVLFTSRRQVLLNTDYIACIFFIFCRDLQFVVSLTIDQRILFYVQYFFFTSAVHIHITHTHTYTHTHVDPYVNFIILFVFPTPVL